MGDQVIIFIVCVYLVTVHCQQQEYDVGSKCINLPREGKCLVPVKTAYDWITAQAACEREGGSLYQFPDANLESRQQLLNCLASMSDTTFDDMWLNAVGLWYPHFFWINITLVNKVNYCTDQEPPIDDDYVPITSDTLSVDYCVSTCHDRGARYIVFHKNEMYTPECYCKHELEAKYQTPCRSDAVNYADSATYFIVHAQEDSLIKLTSAEAFSKPEILCATVDQKTKDSREMRSDTCFTSHPFLCLLEDSTKCSNSFPQCSGTECRFLMREKCMLRVSLNYNWYAARAYCVNKGGDLWNMHELNDMNQVTQFLDGQSRYWIGATNYAWSFNATSSQLTRVNGNLNLVKCGHMFRDRETEYSGWQWKDTECDQQKSFLCEFKKTTFPKEEVNNEVTCPWPETLSTTTLAPTDGPLPKAPVRQVSKLIKVFLEMKITEQDFD